MLKKILIDLEKKNEVKLNEIKEIFEHIRKLADEQKNSGKDYDELLITLRRFLQIVYKYMLMHSKSGEYDIIDQVHKLAYSTITSHILKNHQPKGTLSDTVFVQDSLFTSLIQQEEELEIKTKDSFEHPEYNAELLNLSEDMEKYKQDIHTLIQSNDKLSFDIDSIRKETRERRAIILSILSNLPHDKELELRDDRFIVSTSRSSHPSQIIIFKLDQE